MNGSQRQKIQMMINELESIMEEEQEKYDNAPENLQSTERVEKFQENAEQIQEAIDSLEVAMEI